MNVQPSDIIYSGTDVLVRVALRSTKLVICLLKELFNIYTSLKVKGKWLSQTCPISNETELFDKGPASTLGFQHAKTMRMRFAITIVSY
jgi:hypothetical protein